MSGGIDFEGVERMQFIPGWSTLCLNSGFVLDIMTDVSHLKQADFDECFETSTVFRVHDIPVRFLHYNQLIESKKAAGRPKDLIDIEELEKINKKP